MWTQRAIEAINERIAMQDGLIDECKIRIDEDKTIIELIRNIQETNAPMTFSEWVNDKKLRQ